MMKKFLALTLVLVTAISLFAGCGKSDSGNLVLPTINVEDTLENRQNAIVQTALAYYYKNPYNQYDNIAISNMGNSSGRRGTVDDRNTPEYASADLTAFNVCTSYAYHVVFNSIRYRMLDNARQCLTKDLVMKDGAPESIMLLQHERNDKNMQENIDAMNKLMSLLQPGDIVTYVGESGSGHTVVYCGDLNGDGKGDILHCNGKKYDPKSGLDQTEDDGAILMNHKKAPSAEAFLAGEDFVEYLPKKLRFNLIRPALLEKSEYPLTETAKTRLLYPGLEITFTTGEGHYGAAAKGSQLTYTLTVKNHSQQNHEGILIQIPVPAGTELVSVGETPVTGKKVVKQQLSMPAGSELNIPVTVNVTGNVGDKIVMEGAYVHAIPLPAITTVITSAEYTAQQVSDAVKANADKTGAAFVEAVYAQMGLTVDVPELKEITENLYKTARIGENKAMVRLPAEEMSETGKAISKMVIPYYEGGFSLRTDADADEPRVSETRYYDLQAGDVVVMVQSLSLSEPVYAIFDGEFLNYIEGGAVKTMLEFQYGKVLAYDYFVGLRPAQVG